MHSKAFEDLNIKHKFLSPEGDTTEQGLRTRLISQISRTIAKLEFKRGFNGSYALGHDLGHTPFGHTGEEYLKSYATDLNTMSKV